jgi:hypothetical protein
VLALAGCGAAVAPETPGARRPARATAGLPRFVPQSVSFVSPSSGWAWGPARPYRSSSAGVLARTGDFGRSWSARVEYTYAQPGQPGGYSGVRFADARHGWLFGDGLLATGDGGRHWRAIRTPGNVLELETAGGAAYAVALPCASAERCVSLHLYRVTDAGLARIGPRRPFYAASLTADGASVHLLINAGRRRGSMLWASYDRGRSWRVLRSPCPWDGTDSWALGGWSTRGLGLACGSQGGAGTQAKAFYISTDGGAHWQRAGQPPIEGYVASLAAASPTRWALAEGRYPGILVSGDGGRRWHPARFANPQAPVEGWGYVAFLGAGHAVAVPWTQNGGVLAISRDGGRNWRELDFGQSSTSAGGRISPARTMTPSSSRRLSARRPAAAASARSSGRARTGRSWRTVYAGPVGRVPQF